jgi:hypothetical protein
VAPHRWLAACAVLAACSDSGDDYSLLQVVPNPAPDRTDWFGTTLVAVGDNVVVGSTFDDSDGLVDTGYAELRDGRTGALIRVLAESPPVMNRKLGAIVQPIGARFLVASATAPPVLYEASNGAVVRQLDQISGLEFYTGALAKGPGFLVSGASTASGMIAIFDANGHLSTTLLSPQAEDHYAQSFAVMPTRIAVGAPTSAVAGLANVGSVHLYDGTGAFLRRIDPPVPREKQFFGEHVFAIGDRFVIEEYGTPGATFLYDADGNMVSRSSFVGEVAMVGENYVVSNILEGAGSFALFEGATGREIARVSNPADPRGELFGHVTPLPNGNFVATAPAANLDGVADVGAAYIFDGATGAMIAELVPPSRAEADNFGFTVIARGDRIFVCAPNADVDGIEDVGRVFVFSATSGELVAELHDPEPDAGERFGNPTLTALPHAIAVGVINDPVDGVEQAGSVYLFETQRAQ